jgi:predicted metal-dependent RNase
MAVAAATGEVMMAKRKPPKRRSGAAMALRSPALHSRTVPDIRRILRAAEDEIREFFTNCSVAEVYDSEDD